MSFLKNLFSPKKPQPISSYEEFWSWFRQHARSFHGVVKHREEVERNFFNKLTPMLDQLQDGFFFVTGMMDENTAELVFTAEGRIMNIVFVEELVAAAPEIEGWKFTALKPASGEESLGVSMSGFDFNREKLSFYSNDLAEYPDEIDITLVHKDYTESNKDVIYNGSVIFMDNFLGELNSVSIIDRLGICGPAQAEKELIPIEKLNDFLIWREKEFVEKYEGSRYNTEVGNYAIMEAELENGHGLVAVINTELLEWDTKPSHPWMMVVEIKYDGTEHNGMPDRKTYELLDEIESAIGMQLKDRDGYLNVGRQTSEGCREIYFACKEFRKPSKVLRDIVKKYEEKIEIVSDIYKDKYWRSLNRFRQEQRL
jgi:hypothetical protein